MKAPLRKAIEGSCAAGVLVSLLFLAACGSKGVTYPSLADPSPFHPQKELRIETSATLDVIGTEVPVTVSWQPDGYVQYEWTLETPAGSMATLSDAHVPAPTFTPDVEGAYTVTLTTRIGPTVQQTASRRLLAATYLGVSDCSMCHQERVQDWAATNHATTLQRHGDLLFATPGCTNCHVLASNLAQPAATPGSFQDEAQRLGFDPTTYTDYATFAANYPTLADRGSVQCETCHGPGSLHNGDPRKTTVSTQAKLCGTCHDTFGPTYTQFQLSVHSAAPPAGTIDNPSCARCHTARAFARSVKGEPPPPTEGPDAPGITCAACHDPHSAAHPSQVRVFGTIDLAGVSPWDAGRAATCATCHESDVADPAARADSDSKFPCAVQADMLAGRGAVEYGMTFSSSFHGDPGFELRNFTGNPNDPLYPEACVTCHMAPTPSTAPLANHVGGHTWKMESNGVDFVAGNCDRCHTGLTTFDRNLGKDYDGNGAAEGVQTEVHGLLENLYAALSAADTGGGLSRPGGAGTIIQVAGDLTRTSPQLREAVYNYNFVVVDGSYGVHNTAYTVQLLQRTYEKVTGISYHDAFPLADIR